MPDGPWFNDAMLPSRRGFLFLMALGLVVADGAGAEEGASARLGLLLDTSEEMGFLVPQARKELRILNVQLAAAGQAPVAMREIVGSDLDREASTSVGARRNALYAMKALYEECDTVLWLTRLDGEQSPHGIFSVETLLRETVEGRPARQLVLRHLWQEQVLAGSEWVMRPPGPEIDPLDPRNRPEEWFRLVEEDRGVIQRSWQTPPPDFRAQFAFPFRVADSYYLKKLGHETREANFEQGWARDLAARHDLRFVREREEWLPRITGRRWLEEATLLPFPDEAALRERSAQVFEEMSARESIERDLARVAAEKLGVVFAFGYVSQDWKRHQSTREQPPRNWRDSYLADIARIGSECATHLSEHGRAAGRLYATERVELASKGTRPDAPDPVLRTVARMARDGKCDAIYLFTNGYLGGGDYGTWTLDLDLLTLAIREAGTRLFVRVPFEFGPVPLDVQRLAMASGGGVFQGMPSDPDWEMEIPSPAWPEPATEED